MAFFEADVIANRQILKLFPFSSVLKSSISRPTKSEIKFPCQNAIQHFSSQSLPGSTSKKRSSHVQDCVVFAKRHNISFRFCFESERLWAALSLSHPYRTKVAFKVHEMPLVAYCVQHHRNSIGNFQHGLLVWNVLQTVVRPASKQHINLYKLNKLNEIIFYFVEII